MDTLTKIISWSVGDTPGGIVIIIENKHGCPSSSPHDTDGFTHCANINVKDMNPCILSPALSKCRKTGVFNLGMPTNVEERKLSIQAY